MIRIGIDIGSTASKAAILKEDCLQDTFCMQTGYSAQNAAQAIALELSERGYDCQKEKVAATGYGRISVPYADTSKTEISCHAKGAFFLCQRDATVLDIGGQDTKVIKMKNGQVVDFLMNDKCSAGTGRFIEIMAARLGVTLPELFALASQGSGVVISSMCTVFAESEIISLIGRGEKLENIAYGIVESLAGKAVQLASRLETPKEYFLTGGFSTTDYLKKRLSEKALCPVSGDPLGRYAGAIGAALLNK